MHKNNLTPIMMVLAIMLLTTASVISQEHSKLPWYETVTLNGCLSTAFTYNFNTPDGMKNNYRVFDTDERSFKIDLIELAIKHDALSVGEAGFRVDMTAGSSIPRITRSVGWNNEDIDLQQLYASYIAPVGLGLRFDAGKFVTPLGYELIEGYDGYNDHFSRSLLFGYAIPFTHTGIKLSYPVMDNFSCLVMVVNGWDNTIDNNKNKSVGIGVSGSPVDGMNCAVNVLSGAEKNGENSDYRTVFDLVGTYTATSELTVGLNLDYGLEEHSTPANGTAVWFGIAAYAKFKLDTQFSLALRAEQFEDLDGIRTSIGQVLKEFTLTPEYKPVEQFILRCDIRFDKSDIDVFRKADSFSTSQNTLGFNVIYLF